MEVAERRQLLRASEKPLRATGSGQEAASGEPGSIDLGALGNGPTGSGAAKRPALLSAVLNAVHAGREPGWKSGHLEPLLFGAGLRLTEAEEPASPTYAISAAARFADTV